MSLAISATGLKSSSSRFALHTAALRTRALRHMKQLLNRKATPGLAAHTNKAPMRVRVFANDRSVRFAGSHSDRPFGGLRASAGRSIINPVILLEIGLIVALVAFFIAIDLYVRGCENL